MCCREVNWTNLINKMLSSASHKQVHKTIIGLPRQIVGTIAYDCQTITLFNHQNIETDDHLFQNLIVHVIY